MSSIHYSKRKRNDDQSTLGGNDAFLGNSAECSEEENHGEEVISATTNAFSPLADEMKFLIFAFSHGNKIHGYGGSPVANLFKTCGFLSKDCYQCCIRYVQQNPIKADTGFQSLHYPRIACMCKHRVKLESITLSLHSSLEIGLSMHLLRSCDLTELRSITVNYNYEDVPHDARDRDIAAAIAAGIPRGAIEEFHPMSPSQAALQEIIAGILVEKAPQIEKTIVLRLGKRLCQITIIRRD